MKLNGVIECKFLPKTRTVQHPCPRLGQCRWECPPDHSAQKALANQCLYPSVLFDMGLCVVWRHQRSGRIQGLYPSVLFDMGLCVV